MTYKEYVQKQKFNVDLIINNLENLVNAKSVDDADFLQLMIREELLDVYCNTIQYKFTKIQMDIYQG